MTRSFPGPHAGQIRADPLVHRVAHRLHDRKGASVEDVGGAVADDQLDGMRHLAATEALDALARHQQRLVDVVVRDDAGALEVQAAERDGGRLHHRVADGVGVAESLALHDLDPPAARPASRRWIRSRESSRACASEPAAPPRRVGYCTVVTGPTTAIDASHGEGGGQVLRTARRWLESRGQVKADGVSATARNGGGSKRQRARIADRVEIGRLESTRHDRATTRAIPRQGRVPGRRRPRRRGRVDCRPGTGRKRPDTRPRRRERAGDPPGS